MKEELDKEQVRKDLQFLADKLKKADEEIKEAFERIKEIYEAVDEFENNQEVSKY